MNITSNIIDVKNALRRKHPWKGYTSQRVTTKLWRCMLMRNEDTVVVEGKVKKIIAKSLGADVYELTIEEQEND